MKQNGWLYTLLHVLVVIGGVAAAVQTGHPLEAMSVSSALNALLPSPVKPDVSQDKG